MTVSCIDTMQPATPAERKAGLPPRYARIVHEGCPARRSIWFMPATPGDAFKAFAERTKTALEDEALLARMERALDG
jgi:hypothetical protein